MSTGGQSFLDKLKDVFSKIFKSKKRQESSFKTPQDLQQSRYGTANVSPEKRSPAVAGTRAAEISQTPSAPAPPKTSMQTSRAPPAIQRLREAMNNETADVSPTDGSRTSRADRPSSAAVSALEQEGVADRVNRAGEPGTAKAEVVKEEDRPISDIAAPNTLNTAQSPTIAERTAPPVTANTPSTTETAVGSQAEETDAPPYTDATPQAVYRDEKAQSKYPYGDVEQEKSQTTFSNEKAPAERGMEQEREHEDGLIPADRVDPTTAPEVVNRFDDEKVPVVMEPTASTPAETKFRMSATSGPLEDFPDYYG